MNLFSRRSEINLQVNPCRTDAQAGILVKGGGGRGGSELNTAQVLKSNKLYVIHMFYSGLGMTK